MAKHVYLQKANNDLISHCECETTLIAYPGQMDCPWCGCGWLFSCLNCRKAFSFAVGVETSESWEALAHKDYSGRLDRDPVGDEISEWIASMKDLLEGVEPGENHVYFDGAFIPTSAKGLEFDGWHSRHLIHFVPQLKAMKDESVVVSLLANREYWNARAHKS